MLVLYTDGVTEAMSASGEQFDIDRLREAILEAREKSPAEIRDHVLARVHAWMDQQNDDFSLVVMRYRA